MAHLWPDLLWIYSILLNLFHSHSGGDIIIEGVFIYKGELFIIKKVEHYKLQKRSTDTDLPDIDSDSQKPEMVIYKHEKPTDPNIEVPVHKCGHDHLHYNFHPSGAATFYADEYMKQKTSYRIQPRGTTGCPSAKKMLYMGIAADCSYVSAIGDETKVASTILQNMNIVSGIYEKFFNVAIGIVSMKIFPTCSTTEAAWNRDCSSSAYDISTRLSDFSAWRKTQNADAGLWHLMTACKS